MSDLSGQAGDYLRLRRALGHKLNDAHRLLPRFVAYLDAIGAETVTVEAALAWARRPDADPASSVWMRRMIVARGCERTGQRPVGPHRLRHALAVDMYRGVDGPRPAVDPGPAASRDGGDADRAARRDGHAGG